MLASVGLLLPRLSIGVMMIHHGQEKLADPQQFADTYVASLQLPFPLFFAYAAGFSELIGSWLVMLGLLTPLGALALTATMATAAYQHILTAGLNIYALELVVLYLGGSLALLLNGPGRFSFDAGMGPELIAGLDRGNPAADAAWPAPSGGLTAAAIPVEVYQTGRLSSRRWPHGCGVGVAQAVDQGQDPHHPVLRPRHGSIAAANPGVPGRWRWPDLLPWLLRLPWRCCGGMAAG
jgi:putative oxidoreductase